MKYSVLHDILALAVEAGASDLHIKENHPVALRVHGTMRDTDFVPDSEFIVQFINQMADDKLMEKYHEIGDLDISYVEEDVGRFRVNIHRQRAMHAITMRHVKTQIMNFSQLGLPAVIESLAESPRGIIIISGTTGSGKSTTMAAMLEHINENMSKHIISVEDPIEYEFFDKKSFMEQREVGLDTISFQSALVHALRQDPDVIMVGEMRDKSSFESALQAADTGHMVITTLHATTASQAINRILDFYDRAEQDPIRESLSINLKAIIAQRLMKKAVGEGVVPINEIMVNTPMVRKLLQNNKLNKLESAIENGKDDGMQSFNQSLFNLINEGLITEEDAMEVATNPEALRMNLQGIFLGTDNQILGD